MSETEPLRDTVESGRRRISHSRNLLSLIDGLLKSGAKDDQKRERQEKERRDKRGS